MKINMSDFRVSESTTVDLAKCFTTIDPFYKSKKYYKKMLEHHVKQLGALQQLH